MTKVIGKKIITLSGTFKEVYSRTDVLLREGYSVELVTTKRMWPRFWIIVYHITLTKLVVIDFKEVQSEIDEANMAIDKLKNELGLPE